MAKIKSVALTPEQQAVLEKASRHGKSYSFRQRCLMVLLKSQSRTSKDVVQKDVAQQVGCCEVVVNSWMKRYQEFGMDGLKTKAGRGRKSILQADTDLAAVRQAVQSSRQRISLAKAELQQELGKEFSQLTLRRFLKKTVAVTNAFDDK